MSFLNNSPPTPTPFLFLLPPPPPALPFFISFSSILLPDKSIDLFCAPSYPDPQSSPDERPQPSEEQVQSLEDFIPTNILHFMLINPTVTIVTAEYAYSDVAKKNFKSREKKKRVCINIHTHT